MGAWAIGVPHRGNNLLIDLPYMVTCGYTCSMETNTTSENQTYAIYVYMAKPATYDEFDGFGDYVNFGAKKVCEVGATSEEEALKIAGFTDNHDQLFWASLVA
jgi:hypothetical protein